MERSTVRRSFALPRVLIEEALAAAPPGLQNNLNSLVKEALREYIAHRREADFARAMADMARDPEILRECNRIEREFQAAESDGL
ncbi:MAG: hypothetical protein AMXMBFR33_18180 [Candidatus Xenobia bacterium]